ncbi:MAG: glutamate 5-kinase [Candidatus Omnitrophota bacterium]
MQSQRKYKRIVVKIGSSLLSHKAKLDTAMLSGVSSQVSSLMKKGREIVLVSSGAIALGMSVLKLTQRPKELSFLQASAAVGQNELMDAYRYFFKKRGINCAQLLLTWEDFSDRKRYLNAKSTLNTLLKLKIVPIINENDTVSTDEIKFGDNDRLSALVSILVGADLLIILSDVEGLWGEDKKIIRVVDKITGSLKSLACSSKKEICVGGMVTKLEAANIATSSGIPCVIASGQKKDIIKSVVDDAGSNGTLFLTKGKVLDAKERWMAFGTKSKGRIRVDDGAKNALLNKKSLLSVGIVSCSGNFSPGDVVSICNNDDVEFARGKAGLGIKELEKIQGIRFAKEIIHRDNIVML